VIADHPISGSLFQPLGICSRLLWNRRRYLGTLRDRLNQQRVHSRGHRTGTPVDRKTRQGRNRFRQVRV